MRLTSDPDEAWARRREGLNGLMIEARIEVVTVGNPTEKVIDSIHSSDGVYAWM